MIEPKVSLTVILPGRMTLSKQLCLENNTKEFVVNQKPAYQILNISKEAYTEFVSNSVPSWYRGFNWKLLKADGRLLAHLQRIAEDFGGEIYSYEIL